MPALAPSPDRKVLVTGANGYIGMWIVKALLNQGFRVRGTVRSSEKGEQLRQYFDGNYGGRVEWAIVPDIQKKDAFDEAVKDVDGIIHTASPLPGASSDPDEMIRPAVGGTVNILQSAMQYGSRVSRIVLTSSGAAIIGEVGTGTTVFDETSWGDESVRIVEEQGENAPAVVKYRASKTLSEKAAWAFYDTHKPQLSFDLVTINPPFVLGPPLQSIKTPSELSSSMLAWYRNVMLDSPDRALAESYSYIDIRDVALAHVMALQIPDAGGHRIIVSNGCATWQETRNMIHKLRPELRELGIIPTGNPEMEKRILFTYDPSKGKALLGLNYREYSETLLDMLKDFEQRGWLTVKQIAAGVER